MRGCKLDQAALGNNLEDRIEGLLQTVPGDPSRDGELVPRLERPLKTVRLVPIIGFVL